MFHEKASAEVMLSEKKRAYLKAGLAIKECEYKRRSWEHAEEFKGFGTSSSGLIDKAMYEREKVGKTFFTVMNSKGVREAVASLPNDAEITVGTDGVLRVNNGISEDFHARGCTYETELGGVKYIVDGTADYDGFSNACAGLKFDGTIMVVKKPYYVYSFSFEYNHNSGDPDAEPEFGRLKVDDELIRICEANECDEPNAMNQ